MGWSSFCYTHYLMSAQPAPGCLPGGSEVAPDLSAIPTEYQDLREVFIKSRATSLPPHRPYDCRIDLLPSTTPLPLISSAFEPLQGATVFSKLELRNAYHLVRIREGDEWKTTFNTASGHYEYLVMPFGLTNAPYVFQALVNYVFHDMLNRFIFIYIDDILVFSRSPQEHVLHVRQVLQHTPSGQPVVC
eukprot:XP_013995405.1 PREDICTED: RNA-directed DNA polymerase homolog [Salmo salar]